MFHKKLGSCDICEPITTTSTTSYSLHFGHRTSHAFALVSKNRRHSRTPSWLTRRGHVPMQVLSHWHHETMNSTEIFTKVGMRLVSIIFRQWMEAPSKTHRFASWVCTISVRPSFVAVTLPQGSLGCYGNGIIHTYMIQKRFMKSEILVLSAMMTAKSLCQLGQITDL